jgi:hypothetical protein
MTQTHFYTRLAARLYKFWRHSNPGNYILYSGVEDFRHNYFSIFLYMQKCLLLHTQGTESARQE